MQWHKVLTVARKAGVSLLGVVAAGVAAGWFDSPVKEIAVAVLAIATYAGVYATPNKPSNLGTE